MLKAAIQMFALFLAGCAGAPAGDYPSLAKRPIESGGSEVASQAPAGVQQDPALTKEVGELVAKAKSGGAGFDAGLSNARDRVNAAAGSAVSSEAWVAAELAISTLESERYDSVAALASLDTLYVRHMNAVADGQADGGDNVIDRARTEVAAVVDRQNDVLDGLRDRLAAP